MGRKLHLLVIGTLIVLALPVAAWAGGEEPVPLYTNDDLERLDPIPQQTTPAAPPPSAQDWDFVLRMLDRERSRLEAERQESLERERIAAGLEAEWLRATGGRGCAYGLCGTYPWVHSWPYLSYTPTAHDMLVARVRVPAAQRGIRTVGDAWRESLQESHLRFGQPPSGTHGGPSGSHGSPGRH